MFTKNILASFVCLAVTLSACTSPQSPMTVKASISPAPIVGQAVTLRVEITTSRDAPNTTLQMTLPQGVELMSGDANWQGDIKVGESTTIDLVIRVNQAGDYVIDAYAFARITSESGFGGGKTLYVNSAADHATVTEDVDMPQPTYPAISIDTRTAGPVVTATPSP